MSRTWFYASLIAFSLTLASAWAAEPISAAAPNTRPVAGSDEDELWYAMDQLELELQQSPLLVRDPALNAYVRNIACKVSGDYCQDLRIYILDLPYFNASMAPNGVLVLWTGALLRIQNEADLALVLGHEFGHYRQRHTLQQWRKLKNNSGFLSTFGVLTAGIGLGVVGMAANLAGAANMMKFSRDKEREADQIGFAQLVAQSYDPNSAVALWDRMLREESAHDYGKPLPVFASHPQTRERRDDLRVAATAITNPGKELGLERYRAATHSLLEHWLENELTRRMYASSIQVISDLRQICAATDAGLFTFYLAEAHRRRNKNDDLAQAASLYALAVTEPGAPAQAWREYGWTLRQARKNSEAIAAFNHYLELAPAAEDRAFIARYLTELETTP